MSLFNEHEIIRIGDIMETRRIKKVSMSRRDRDYADKVLTQAKRNGYSQVQINLLLKEGAEIAKHRITRNS